MASNVVPPRMPLMRWNELSTNSPSMKNHTTTRVGKHLYLFGGFDGRVNHNNMHLFNCETQKWEYSVRTYGRQPRGRNGHTATFAKGKIWIIGGWLGKGPLAADDVYTFTVATRSWERQNTTGDGPGPCNMHSADYIPRANAIFVFRGGDAVAYMNDLHTLNVESNEWTQPITKGTPPLPRANHSSATIGSNLYIFGGWNGTNRLNDLNVLDTEQMTWSTVRPSGPIPAPRAGMSMTAVQGKLFLFGGSGHQTTCFNDLHVYDPVENMWLETSPSIPEPNAKLSDNINTNETLQHKSTSSCEGLQVDRANPNSEPDSVGLKVGGEPPGWRAGHTATLRGRMLYIIGGSYSSSYLSDMFSLDTDYPVCIGLPPVNPSQIFQRSVKTFVNNQEYSDVTFIVEGKPVYCHRLILSLMSEHFRALFSGGFIESQESVVHVPDLSYDVFMVMMEYIYSGEIPSFLMNNCDKQHLSRTNVHELNRSQLSQLSSSSASFTLELLHAADQYMLETLKVVCQAVLQRIVNNDTVDLLLREAIRYNATQLEDVCRHYIRNRDELSNEGEHYVPQNAKTSPNPGNIHGSSGQATVVRLHEEEW